MGTPGAPLGPPRTAGRGRGSPASRGAPAPRPPPCRPGALILLVLAVLLPVQAASATTTGPDSVHQQLSDPEGCSGRKCCLPGFYYSEDTGDCTPCDSGVDFTKHTSIRTICRFCSQCHPGEEKTRACTVTADRVCQCKPGTYYEANSLEMCLPCSPRCPDGMVQATPCTPWNDLTCVKGESGTEDNGQVRVTGEDTSPGPPTTPSTSSGIPHWATAVIVPVTAVCVPLLYACYRWRHIFQAPEVNPKRVDRVCFCFSCLRRQRRTRNIARKEIVSNRTSQSILNANQELVQQEHIELTRVTVQPPEEAVSLLEPAKPRRVSDEEQAAISSNGVGPH